jgi:hypothetical protein
MDCQGPGCDQNYYRTEIAWVNWVRDPSASHVHIIVTSQTTGAGGRSYQLDFTGREPFEEYADQLVLQTATGDTERERLDALAHTLSLGLARFADLNGYRGIVRFAAAENGGGQGGGAPQGIVSAEQVSDPWNLWTFRIGGSFDMNGQATSKNMNVNANFSASRVTPAWRVSYGANISHQNQERELSDGTFVNKQTNWGFNGMMVNALAGHWSGGFRVNVQRMTSFNQDAQVGIMPALEYSYFPYEEATRRSLTVLYQVGPQYRNYMEETVFGLMEQTLVEHELEVQFNQRQTWGDAGFTITANQFLDDPSKYRFGVNGDLSFRIFRGLNLNARANWNKSNNQIYLASDGVTDEEALLGLRQRASTYNYGFNVGFNYQFGSIFNNVVNNRFGGGGGPGGFGGGFGGGPGGGGGGGGRGGGGGN